MANRISLLEYASRTVDFVKRSGDTYFAVCPFHKEKTASLAVKSDENYYFCFGCGAFGNIYSWIQKTEHLTFDQAVKKVAQLTNTDIKDYVESETVSFFKLLKKANTQKKEDVVDRQSLDIDVDYRNKFEERFPQEWIDEGISPDEMRKYEIRIDPSSNRVVYPVYDADYNLIGIKGRTLFKDYKSLKISKYMNYKPLGIMNFLTGMKQAEPFVKEKNEIIIFEGLKSVMKADSWGFHNCVSAETSKLNDYQIELLIRMQIRDIVIAFDKDVPPSKIRSNVELLKRFTNLYMLYDKWKLLDEKDSPPDKGEETFRYLYENRIRL